jgi:hypothetical protein
MSLPGTQVNGYSSRFTLMCPKPCLTHYAPDRQAIDPELYHVVPVAATLQPDSSQWRQEAPLQMLTFTKPQI